MADQKKAGSSRARQTYRARGKDGKAVYRSGPSGKRKNKRSKKWEIVFFSLAGALVLAVVIIIIAVCASASAASGGGGAIVLPCCQ